MAIRPATLFVALLAALPLVYGQRITTIQLDGVQYFVSRMNPYSPELNYFLAYQYCRSLGLQLTSFESREKSDSITQYLRNAGYSNFDFWTSGNRLGTDMFLWMSTGLPFNATFDYINQPAAGATDNTAPIAPDTSMVENEQVHAPLPGGPPPAAAAAAAAGAGMLRRPGSARQSKSGPSSGCVALKAPDLHWDVDDCTVAKDFICEQTRCYYYNYGSIPVSTSQGRRGNRDRSVNLPRTTSKPTTERPTPSTTTTTTTSTTTTTQVVPVEPSASPLSNELPTSPEPSEDASTDSAQSDDVTTLTPEDATLSTAKSFHVGMLPKGKVLEHDTARTPGITDLIRKWSFPAGIPLEIPVPRKVGGSSAVNAN